MTTSEIDRLSRILTDMRVESAGQFARLDERLNVVPQLASRVARLEETVARQGRFSWGDALKFTTAISAACGVAITIIQVIA